MIGIGGIGMSALAQLYAHMGVRVTGSDRGTSPVTDLLHTKDITVYIGHDAMHVSPETEVVVYSDAVPEDNPERVRARELGIRTTSYFQALGEATKEGTSIVVSGTHGKTTTTAMLAKILIDAGKQPTVIAGSILSEHGSNFVAGRSDLFVIEGCEYRRHFLELTPHIFVITNIELDHTDYYKDLADIQDAFRAGVQRVPATGTVVTDTTSPTITPVLGESVAPVMAYQECVVPLLRTPGAFNQANAQAAKVAALALDPTINSTQVDASLASFRGTWRRFEYKGVTKHEALVYDDYAHHPTAVSGTLTMIRAAFPGKKIIVVFHPHLYSRTKTFFTAFASALAQADQTLLLPIYAAREVPDPSVNSEALSKAINTQGGCAQFVRTFDEAETLLAEAGADALIVTMGAGDVYKLADALIVHPV